jgi:hexosaminidase
MESQTLKGVPMNVVPLPTRYTTGNDVVCLSPNFQITFPGLNPDQIPKDLQYLTTKTEWHIFNHRHRYLSVHRGAEFFDEDKGGKGCVHHLTTLEIVIDHKGQGGIDTIMGSAIKPAEERPELEAYTLSVPTSGSAVIKSSTALGALRGLSTFVNLFYHLPKDAASSVPDASGGVLVKPNILSQSEQLPLGSGGYADQDQQEQSGGSKSETEGTTYAPGAPYEIEDKPAFGWRAVLLDTSRNWFGMEAIKRVSTST